MFNKKLKRAICIASSATMLMSMVPTTAGAAVNERQDDYQDNVYAQRFLDLYNIIKNPNTGYFNEDGIPYHSIETLMVEAPDQGHESTSETASYLGWLEAMNGEFTGDFSGLEKAWDVIEKYYIPTDKDQPGQTDYTPSSPATYADEYDDPSKYPSELKFGKAVGEDPLYNELKNTYNTTKVYGMHWLIDVDNFYGFGQRGSGKGTAYINTYQRGKQESCFETVPQPSWESFNWGKSGEGFLSLFTGDKSYSKQWRYTNAPDADARLIQAMWSARNWADQYGVDISKLTDKASRMGDYLRYSMFDKYFMKIGANGATAASGRDSQHYLLSWYYAWGGATDANWCWRIGCSHSHFGYQDPMAAYVLSSDDDFIPKSRTAQGDWEKSLDRQIELYQWLQSDEGAIAGGCTNSWNGSYDTMPSGTSTFYGMGYTPHPVYEDPGSNRWFGMQGWSMQRMCEYYAESGDERVKDLVTKWAKWVMENVSVVDGKISIPSNLIWTGQPDTWTGSYTGNKGLHCEVETYGEDVGVAGSICNALLYYAKATGDMEAKDLAQEVLDCLWDNYKDDQGIAVDAPWDSANRFFEQEVYVPSSYTGKMPSGATIQSGVTFYGLRPQYENDKDFARLLDCYNNGKEFTMKYHRFWAQVEVAVANGVMANLFGNQETMKCEVSASTDVYYVEDGGKIRINANASTTEGDIDRIEITVDGEEVGTIYGNQGTVRYLPSEETKEIEIVATAYSTNGDVKESKPVYVKVVADGEVIPTATPTATPTIKPTVKPTVKPTATPTQKPTATPTVKPTVKPTVAPTQSSTGNADVTLKGALSGNTIGGTFEVKGNGTNLKDVVFQYSFVDDGKDINVYIDNASVSYNRAPYYECINSNMVTKVVRNGANSYIEVSFNKDVVLDSSVNVQVQMRAAKSDWSNFSGGAGTVTVK